MSAQLIPLNGGPFPTISLQRPVVLIGRHPECDVRLELSRISRRHCCVALAYDRILIRDLGSRNGLRVNGRTVDEAQLHHGDEIAIGPILYRLECPPVVVRPTPPAAPPTYTPKPTPPVLPPDEDDLIPLD